LCRNFKSGKTKKNKLGKTEKPPKPQFIREYYVYLMNKKSSGGES